jgi:hypothetical protein
MQLEKIGRYEQTSGAIATSELVYINTHLIPSIKVLSLSSLTNDFYQSTTIYYTLFQTSNLFKANSIKMGTLPTPFALAFRSNHCGEAWQCLVAAMW